MAREYTDKDKYNRRFNSLKKEFDRWKPALMEIRTYVDPTRGIFDGNRDVIGKAIDHKVLLDSHATHSKRITASGMQTGMTDPSRPWFKLTLDDFLVENVSGVREWLDETTRRMIEVLNKSNIYKVFQDCYDEVVQFATGCFIILEDFEDVIRGFSFTCGEYYIGVDNKGRVNRFAREFEMTVSQLVEEFGLESCSGKVQAHYKNNELDISIKIRHMIEPNPNRVEGYMDNRNMPYQSCYWEDGQDQENFLAKRGYKRFRIVAPRWSTVTTQMAYGYGPTWHAIGDIKELQVKHRDLLIAEEKAYNPPVLDDGAVNGHINMLPGGITKISTSVPNSGLRPAYQVEPHIAEMNDSIERLHRKIDRHLFADIFLMISNLERSQITAFEVAKRDQERMMMLGPILHTLNEEMHDVSIDIIFDIMLDNGLIPEPPEEIAGMDLKVQYISILAQAQKAIGVEQINTTITTIGSWAPINPEVVDIIDFDAAGREVASLGGSPAKIVREKSKVDAIREERMNRENKAIAMEAAEKAAKTSKDLAASPVNGEQQNMLDVVGQAVGGRA